MRHKVKRCEIKVNSEDKKGFTLVELLAVVVIISIVLGVSYMVYAGVINKSKEKATILAMNNLRQAAIDYGEEENDTTNWLSSYDRNGKVQGKYICIRVQQLINMGYFKDNFFNKSVYDDKVRANTFIEVSKGLNGSDVRAKITELNSQQNCELDARNDKTYNIDIKNEVGYTDRLHFELKPKDSSVNVTDYWYTYNGVTNKCSNGSCELNNLVSSSVYPMKVCMNINITDENSSVVNKTICDNVDMRTKDFKEPNISIGKEKKWTTSKNISIKYYDDNIYNNDGQHYFKSAVDALLVSGKIYTCRDYSKDSCSSTLDNKVSANRIYMTSDDNVKLKVTEEILDYKIIEARIQDSSNNYAKTSKKVTKIDKTPPLCISSGGSDAWTNKSVTLIGKCKDDGSGCKKITIKKLISTGDTQVSPGIVEDNAGNKTTCEKQTVKIDKTAPTCSVSYSGGAKGNKGWYKSGTSSSNPVKANANCSDSGGSGCKEASVNIDTQYKDGTYTKSKTIYDNAGNSVTCSSSMKIDVTNPTCSVSGGANNWTNKTVTLTGTCSDKGSLCVKDKVTQTFTNSTSGNFSPGIVEDKAGNKTECAKKSVKIDKTAPTCSVNYSGGSQGNNGWYKSGTSSSNPVKANANCSDSGGSGCKEASVNIDTQYKDGTYTKSKTIYDNAGNSVTCSSSMKIDVTNPTCSVSGGANNWTNKTVTLTGTCSDKGSLCVKDKVTQTFTNSTSGNFSPGIVEDKAGNKTECAKKSVKIDKTAPTCSVNYSGGSQGNNGWYKSGTSSSNPVKANANCSDSGGSGCKEASVNIDTQYKDGTYTKSKTIYDNAGNGVTCSSTIRIDGTNPTCSSSGGSSEWTRNDVTISGKCSDSSGGSGCIGDTSRTINYDTNSNISPGTVYDNAGNQKSCPDQLVKIDKTAPNFSSLDNPTGGKWTKSDFALTGKASDSASGIGYWYYQYGSDSWNKYDGSSGKTTFKTTNFSRERNESVKIWVCDNVGNCSFKSTKIKIDKTPPKLASWHKTKNLPCGKYKATYGFQPEITDAGSGYQKGYFDWKGGKTWPTENRNGASSFKECITSDTSYANQTIKYKLCDVAGNCTKEHTKSNF